MPDLKQTAEEAAIEIKAARWWELEDSIAAAKDALRDLYKQRDELEKELWQWLSTGAVIELPGLGDVRLGRRTIISVWERVECEPGEGLEIVRDKRRKEVKGTV